MALWVSAVIEGTIGEAGWTGGRLVMVTAITSRASALVSALVMTYLTVKVIGFSPSYNSP
ncbi:hypothetical protein M405DRAFT_806317 [Rhizopogon salebrosus TDB-379]|nr:hypothetical protein M405DRAFT_806317 [Rhizopogon salebrosus TDB-379]